MNTVLSKIIILMICTLGVYAGGFLMPQDAFKPYAKVYENNQIKAGITLGEGIYLYVDKVDVSFTHPVEGIHIEKVLKPKAQELHGAQVYQTSPEFTLVLTKDADVTGTKQIPIHIQYQGCSEAGLCYEPYTKDMTVTIDTTYLPQKGAQTALKTQKKSIQKKEKLSKTDAIAQTMKEGNLLLILGTFFLFGLLLSLTPCVFPMIPIISGLIVAQGEGVTTKKAFLLSVVYVLAMAVAYTIAGVLAGLFGSNLQAALQTPWVVYSFAGIFVALAFSMFGFYELKLPDALVAKVSSQEHKGGYIGVAVMGFLSALIVGPCVAAPLAGALVYIGQTGDALLGAGALFSMSIGMGLPLIVVGVSAGKFMPRPGGWMTLVNATFGVVMLGVAIWMLEKVIAPDVVMLMYALLGLGFSLYLGVFKNDHHFFKHFIALVIFLYSVALFIGFLAGNTSMRTPLSFMQHATKQTVQQKDALNFHVISSIDELDAILQANKAKKIMLDFSAQWCTACKELEEKTFSDKRVQQALQEYVLVRADVTDNTQEQKALSKKYGVFGPPVVLFFDNDGAVQKDKTIVGFVEPEEFLKHL